MSEVIMADVSAIVPMLRVGMQPGMLRVPEADANLHRRTPTPSMRTIFIK
ncbi:hypothetical protein FBY12_0754 [Pseudomonas sp. SJZ131]|nr:hypothetical protein FBY12_0754 [Pseudomonas sp. SJZ131]